MKSLEQVIKQKCKFIGNTTENYQTLDLLYTVSSGNLLFMSNMTVETTNVITLLEEMTPLLVYISSRACYDQLQHDRGRIYISLRFTNTYVSLEDSLYFGRSFYETPLVTIQGLINAMKTNGYCMSFQKPVCVEILFKSRGHVIDNSSDFEDDEIEPSESEEDEIEPINDIKTFKHDLCTICLERIPNVLFCLCGHICICEKCNEIKNLNSCPICKTENNILSKYNKF